MRSKFLIFLLLASCQTSRSPVFRRLVILPVENLSANPQLDGPAFALGLWDALQAQPALHTVLAQHRRELPSLQPAETVEGYVDTTGYHLTFHQHLITCPASLDECLPRLTAEVAAHLRATPRPLLHPASLRCLAAMDQPGFSDECLEKAVAADPHSSLVWLRWAGRAYAAGGPAAAVALLAKANQSAMTPFDAARLAVAEADWRHDLQGRARALVRLAQASPADMDAQVRGAEAALATGLPDAVLPLLEPLLARESTPALAAPAAYAAALTGDVAKAARYASAASPEVAGDIAFYTGDWATAAREFARTPNAWKTALAAARAGQDNAAAPLEKQLESDPILHGVWDWHRHDNAGAYRHLELAAQGTRSGKAMFFRALMALHEREFGIAHQLQRELPPASIESAVLDSLLTGAAPPPSLPFPPEALTAIRLYLRKDFAGAKAAFAAAKAPSLATLGQWPVFAARLEGKKDARVFPPSPDDWLAILLRD